MLLNFELVVFKYIFVSGIVSSSCEIVLMWMPQEVIDNESTLV